MGRHCIGVYMVFCDIFDGLLDLLCRRVEHNSILIRRRARYILTAFLNTNTRAWLFFFFFFFFFCIWRAFSENSGLRSEAGPRQLLPQEIEDRVRAFSNTTSTMDELALDCLFSLEGRSEAPNGNADAVRPKLKLSSLTRYLFLQLYNQSAQLGAINI